MIPTTDEWGTFVSGYAPVRDAQGRSIAILGIDMFLTTLDQISAETFSPAYTFIAIFIAFILIRYCALNRSLLHECWLVARRKTSDRTPSLR